MPTAQFTVQISVENREIHRGHIVVADVVKYLTYADRTDLYGYHGKTETVDTKPSKNGTYYSSVTIRFSAPVADKSEIERWQSEMEQLSRVKEYECVSNEIEA